MRLQVVAIGRLKAGPERELADRYRERAESLARGLGLSGPEVAEMPEARGRRAEERRTDEAGRLRDRAGSSLLVTLDERAPSPTSLDFAGRLAAWRDGGLATVSFVIGGPDGLDPVLRPDGAPSIGFGRLTLPHGLVRVLVLEQIYRALTILSGHPYHRAGDPG